MRHCSLLPVGDLEGSLEQSLFSPGLFQICSIVSHKQTLTEQLPCVRPWVGSGHRVRAQPPPSRSSESDSAMDLDVSPSKTMGPTHWKMHRRQKSFQGREKGISQD